MKWLGKLLRTVLVWWLPTLVLLLVIVIGTAWWCAGTERGTRAVLGALATQFNGRADDIHGSLLGELKVGSLALHLPGADIELADLDLDIEWKALVSARLQMPFTGVASYAVDPDTGISVRYWRGSDIQTGNHIHRWDCMYGAAVLDPFLGTGVCGS